MFWLQAATFMRNALPTSATRNPSLPSPMTPSVRPSTSRPTTLCHGAPLLSRAFSWPIRRVSSRISPQAMAVVGLPKLPVPQTVTLRSLAASRSMARLTMPVVMRRRRSGNASISTRGNGVRSRMATTMAKLCSMRATLAEGPSGSLNTLMSRSPATFDQSAISRATF